MERKISTKEYTFEQIMTDLKARRYSPVYLLMGEEDYYIDRIASCIEETVLDESEKDFNLSVLYGADLEYRVNDITALARRFPMMADHQVVIVREAQMIRNLDELSVYLQKPMSSTILVLCYMHGTFDRRKKLTSLVKEKGILFESKRLKDSDIPRFISSYLRGQGLAIEETSAHLLADYVGSNLSRLVGELNKLAIVLPPGEKRITSEQIEKNIGISKEFNIFEFRKAVAERNAERIVRIADYMIKNSKQNPVQMIFASLFGFFSNLMLAYYAPSRTEEGVAAFLGLRSPWQAKEYVQAMRHYTGMKTLQIIHELRMADARSKGIGTTSSFSDGDNLCEFVHFLLH